MGISLNSVGWKLKQVLHTPVFYGFLLYFSVHNCKFRNAILISIGRLRANEFYCGCEATGLLLTGGMSDCIFYWICELIGSE